MPVGDNQLFFAGFIKFNFSCFFQSFKQSNAALLVYITKSLQSPELFFQLCFTLPVCQRD